ncbi:DEAD/DEAH box helicase family protein [Streptacidiphilus sp. PAMC 29251]
MHVDNSPEPRALLINGTVGAGKTSAAVAVGDLLTTRGMPHAVIDLDWLSQSWPTPQGDPFNFDLLLRNLRGIATNYLDAGAVRLVLAGVVEEHDERKQFRQCGRCRTVGVPAPGGPAGGPPAAGPPPQ